MAGVEHRRFVARLLADAFEQRGWKAHLVRASNLNDKTVNRVLRPDEVHPTANTLEAVSLGLGLDPSTLQRMYLTDPDVDAARAIFDEELARRSEARTQTSTEQHAIAGTATPSSQAASWRWNAGNVMLEVTVVVTPLDGTRN